VSKLAKKKKISISQLVQLLIDAANQSFDEILSPVREDFRKGGMTEVQLDERVGRARKKVLAKSRGKSRKSTMGGNHTASMIIRLIWFTLNVAQINGLSTLTCAFRKSRSFRVTTINP